MTPTERQIADFEVRPLAEQFEIAVECLHAFCQRALRLRDENRHFREGPITDRRNEQIQSIYANKTAFLEAAALAGRIQVRTFKWRTPTTWTCGSCRRTWRGGAGMCFQCKAPAQGVEGEQAPWWLYLVGTRKFLSPHASEAIRRIAAPCVPMNPASSAQQGLAEPPYTIEAQQQILERMTANMRGKGQ